jgi:sporulation protein YlmC with PRC-barrel domain
MIRNKGHGHTLSDAWQTLEDIMLSKIAIALVSTALLTGSAFAQSTMSKSDTPAATSLTKEGWRASKLSGVNVYNEQNEKIGDISDVILDKSGKASAVIIGVGGFLGLGEHLVSVPYDKVKWVNEPVRSTTASSTTSDRPASTASDTARSDNQRTTGAATTSATTTRSSSDNWYPDHAVFSATKDELKQMPEFKY